MAKLARVITVFSLLVLFGADALAQDTPTYTTTNRFRKWTEGQYPSADSINANWDELDALVGASPDTTKLVVAPFYSETATGAAWAANADDRMTFFPFTLPVPMTPDSAYIFGTANNNTGDSIKYTIYSWDKATLHCESGWASPAASSSNQRIIAKFSTTTRLDAGTYIIGYWTKNVVSNGPIPTAHIITGTQFLTGARNAGGSLRIGQVTVSGSTAPSSITGETTMTASNIVQIVLIGQ